VARSNDAQAGPAADIEQTREEFGDSAAALADSATPTIEKAQRFANEKPLVAIGVALVAVVVLGPLLSR
jgi:ElaB/YqjD/DUF883 family membrane-anchored ribosome-binding protein